MKSLTRAAACAGVLALSLAACGGQEDPLTGSNGKDTGTIVIGSQQYYSNTIIAEIYAQALESEGYTVQREFEIGQREVYASELEDGNIDVFPNMRAACSSTSIPIQRQRVLKISKMSLPRRFRRG